MTFVDVHVPDFTNQAVLSFFTEIFSTSRASPYQILGTGAHHIFGNVNIRNKVGR